MHRPSSRVARVVVFSTYVVLVAAHSASAQFLANMVKNAGVGASIGLVHTTDSDVEVGSVYGFSVSLAPRAGWDWAGSLGWFSGDLLIDSGRTTVGDISVKPFMGGIGYTWVTGRLATTASLTAGISLNSADIADRYREAFGPGTTVDLDMDNSWCVRPAVEFEYTLMRKVALTAYTSYFWTKIDSQLRTPAGTFTDQWNASSVQASVGVVLYPFR
jgi:hypothetical protein